MVRTPLDEDETIQLRCMLCNKPITATRIWIEVCKGYWMGPTVHNRCHDLWLKKQGTAKKHGFVLPERFAQFDPNQADADAWRACGAFTPESKLKTLVVMGPPSRGKSRILWATADEFFAQLGGGSLDAYLFEKLMAEYDKPTMARIAACRFALIDDIGAVESYGRERAALQSALRTRIKNGLWTFLSIDSLSFDPGLEDVFKGRAMVVTV